MAMTEMKKRRERQRKKRGDREMTKVGYAGEAKVQSSAPDRLAHLGD